MIVGRVRYDLAFSYLGINIGLTSPIKPNPRKLN